MPRAAAGLGPRDQRGDGSPLSQVGVTLVLNYKPALCRVGDWRERERKWGREHHKRLGEARGAPDGPVESPAPPHGPPFWTRGIQQLKDVCLDNEAVVDLIRLVVTLARLPSRIQESRVAAKVFLRFYFLHLILHVSSQNEVRSGLSPKRGRETALRPRPASTVGTPVSILLWRWRTADVWNFVGNFHWSGKGKLWSKNIRQRGKLICSIKPKPECRENVFAHNTGLIRLNQNAHICISTQDYFNPTWFFKYRPNFHRSFYFCYFFFFL